MEDVSWRYLRVRVAYLQGERQPLLGPNEVELPRTYPSKLHKQMASENVSRSLCV